MFPRERLFLLSALIVQLACLRLPGTPAGATW